MALSLKDMVHDPAEVAGMACQIHMWTLQEALEVPRLVEARMVRCDQADGAILEQRPRAEGRDRLRIVARGELNMIRLEHP
jgi:hypothetical protein